MKKDATLGIRISEDLKEKIERKAKEKGMSKSELIESALKKTYLADSSLFEYLLNNYVGEKITVVMEKAENIDSICFDGIVNTKNTHAVGIKTWLKIPIGKHGVCLKIYLGNQLVDFIKIDQAANIIWPS